MILVIRIAGLVDMTESANETLFRMRLRRKYSAIILKDNDYNRKLLSHVNNFVAFGNISKEDLTILIEKRGMPVDKKKKIDAKKAVESLDKHSLEESNVKPFFRLHPPRGGIDSKLHIGVKKGVLGDHKDKINILLKRML